MKKNILLLFVVLFGNHIAIADPQPEGILRIVNSLGVHKVDDDTSVNVAYNTLGEFWVYFNFEGVAVDLPKLESAFLVWDTSGKKLWVLYKEKYRVVYRSRGKTAVDDGTYPLPEDAPERVHQVRKELSEGLNPPQEAKDVIEVMNIFGTHPLNNGTTVTVFASTGGALKLRWSLLTKDGTRVKRQDAVHMDFPTGTTLYLYHDRDTDETWVASTEYIISGEMKDGRVQRTGFPLVDDGEVADYTGWPDAVKSALGLDKPEK